MDRYLIIADDLTGALDTGVQLRMHGLEVDVTFNLETAQRSDGSIVLDTESRNSPPSQARTIVSEMLKDMPDLSDYSLIYKKVDSTLRGNILPELEVVLECCAPERVIFAPAFPSNGRTTINGTQLLNGVPLLETEIAHDPISPLQTDQLGEILEGLPGNIRLHSLAELRSTDLNLDGARFHCFDAERPADLERVAETGLRYPGRVLWVGSAGLASAIFNLEYPGTPALAVVGSLSQVSIEQISEAEGSGAVVVQLSNLLSGGGQSVAAAAAAVVGHLRKRQDVILTAARSREDYNFAVSRALEQGIEAKALSSLVRQLLAAVVKQAATQVEVSGLFLTGGDTAVSVLDTLGAHGSRIQYEVERGIVLSELSGGDHDGLPVITKAGAFGDPDAIVDSLAYIKSYGLMKERQ